MIDERAFVSGLPTDLFIDGEWRSASDDARVEVVDPSN